MDKETFVKIAKKCSAYNYEGQDSFTSSLTPASGEKSCVNCKHLYKGRCQFDLIDEILPSISGR